MNESSTLRQQFELLQNQHKKKLMLRKQKMSSQESVVSEKNVRGINEGTCSHNSKGSYHSNDNENGDDLELQLNDDLNEDLSSHQILEYDNKIRELKDENGRLYKLLAEREEEMRILNKQINKERQAIAGSGPASETAVNKIMELSKKNRELTSLIEKEKQNAKQLSFKLNEMENQNTRSAIPVQITKQPGDDSSKQKSDTQALEEKLKQAQAKMTEYRNQCEILKKEAKVAQKVIAKECGEGVTVATVLNEPSAWRGRQQQITSLQNKVNELKAQLNEIMRSTQSSATTQNKNFDSARRTMTPSFHDEKHKQMLKQIQRSKKEEHERVRDEFQVLNEQHTKLQTKFDASKTRNKILSSELKGLKEQMKMLVEKGGHDDELIAALMREQERLKKIVEKKNFQIAERESHSRQEKVHHDSEVVARLTQLCKEREEKVAQLERELKSIAFDFAENANGERAGSVDKATLTEDFAVNHGTLSRLHHGENMNYNLTTDEVESQRKRNLRPSSERNSNTSSLPPTPPRSGNGKRKSHNAASGHKHLEEYQTLYEATKVERDKLVELVAVFQQREKDVQESTRKMSSEMKNLQRRNVELEKKIGRAQTQRFAQESNGRKQRSKIGTDDEHIHQPYYVEELETQLAIQKDENDALKEALESTLEGKREDFDYYQNIVEETKKVFLEGLSQYKNSCGSKATRT